MTAPVDLAAVARRARHVLDHLPDAQASRCWTLDRLEMELGTARNCARDLLALATEMAAARQALAAIRVQTDWQKACADRQTTAIETEARR